MQLVALLERRSKMENGVRNPERIAVKLLSAATQPRQAVSAHWFRIDGDDAIGAEHQEEDQHQQHGRIPEPKNSAPTHALICDKV